MNNGYSSYQAGADMAQYSPAQQGAQVFIRDTVNKVSTVDGILTESTQSYSKGSSADLNPYSGVDSVLSTARAPNGMPVTEILPSTLVTIGGLQGTVAFFVKEGYLQKAADGTYTEGSAQSVQAAQAAPEAAPDAVPVADHFPLHPSQQDQINQALETVEQCNLDGLIASGIGFATGRLDAAALAQKFSQLSGLHGEDASARVATIRNAYQAQADQALTTRSGISGDDIPAFWTWAKAHHAGALAEAAQKQIRMHDVSGYAALANRWTSSVAPSIAALKAAGHPTRNQGQGQEVFLKGQWMSPGAAARAGLI